MRCLVCSTLASREDELENVDVISPFSKKSVSAIIKYLAKIAEPSIDITWTGESYEWQICKTCLEDVLAFDEYMVKLREVQKRIISFLRKVAIKEEYIEFEALDDAEYSHQGSNPNLIENELKAESNYEDFENFENSNDDENDNGELEETVKSTTSARRYNTPVKCSYCNKVIKNKSQLRQHIKAEHKPFKKTWKCEICGAAARNEEYLELHMNIHEGKSVLECRYCNKRYRRKINVIEHMQKHWDKKNLQCERCGLRFSERPTYYNHKLQHEAEEDPLICPVCNQSFKTRRTYKNHLWVHREDRPRFDCEICGKTFVEKYTLKMHLRCHNEKEGKHNGGRRKTSNVLQHEEKQFECIICGDKFQSNDLFDQHMKLQHDVVL